MKKRKCIMKNMETGAENKNQQTAIYVMTHKAFTPPPDPLYIPLHVGRAAALPRRRTPWTAGSTPAPPTSPP